MPRYALKETNIILTHCNSIVKGFLILFSEERWQ